MINIVAITLNLIISVLLLALIAWFEQEGVKIEAINKEHREDIRRLQKITQINSWLDSVVKPMLKAESNTSEEADENLIHYFDKNVNKYNFLVKNYIHEDEVAKNIDLSYKIDRNRADLLLELINIEYKDGFVQFRELKMDDKEVNGIVQLIQPYHKQNNSGENNASQQ